MPTSIMYSARRKDLVTPFNEEAVFFPNGCPATDEALCVELSRLAYGQFETSDHDKQRILAALTRIGLETTAFFSVSSGYLVDTQGFLTTTTDKRLSILAFRGTQAGNLADLRTDADFQLTSWREGGKVHRGFAHALLAVWPQLVPFLRRIEGRLLFTGHSLGGALATLAASKHPPTALYTFGASRTGNKEFTQTLAAVDVQRYVDCCDLITQVPPTLFGYRHTGTLQYIDRHGARTTNPSRDSIHADRVRARAVYRRMYAWQSGTVEVRGLADHALINYISGITGRQG